MPCAAGSLNCTLAATGNTYGVLTGFAAGSGYDEATGLGSLNVANVVNAWSAATGSAIATVAATATPSSIVANQSVSVAVTVAGSSGTPTGSVTLSGGGYTSSSQTLSAGSTTFTVPANSLSAGADTMAASYSGDPTYAPASGTSIVTVTALPTPGVTVTPASGSINSGQSLNVTAAVAGTGGTPTGTVTLSSGGYTSSAQTLASGSYTIAIPANSLSAGNRYPDRELQRRQQFTQRGQDRHRDGDASVYTLGGNGSGGINRGSAGSLDNHSDDSPTAIRRR